MSMEVVNNFNRELKTLFMTKLPVSRQKMSLITKSAMKALKFYKHVVQSVEKFIHKCGPDYKVPGLYVIDAIVRQSRHQYCEKDVFGPRFLKNIVSTFLSLSQCEPKDMPLMLRVLNLWQKNAVFPVEMVQSLIDLVVNPNNMDLVQNATAQVTLIIGEQPSGPTSHLMQADNVTRDGAPPQHSDVDAYQQQTGVDNDDQHPLEIVGHSGGLISSVTQLLAKFQSSGHDAADQIRQLQSLQDKIVEQSHLLAQGQMMDSTVLAELHTLMEELTRRATQAAALQQTRRMKEAEIQNVVEKGVLDFDYGDESSEGSDVVNTTNKSITDPAAADNEIVIDLDLVAQLEQMTETLAQTRALQEELKKAREIQSVPTISGCVNNVPMEGILSDTHDHDYRQLPPMVPPIDISKPVPPPPIPAAPQPPHSMQVFDYHHFGGKVKEEPSLSLEEGEIDVEPLHHTSGRALKGSPESGDYKHRSSPDSKKRPSNSRSRSRSGSRRGSKRSRRSKSRERRKKESHRRRERDHERRKNGLPTLKDRRVCVISRTVFIGHLHKHTTEAKVLDLVETFGAVDEFNLIPPRGCAFVTYSKRKSGFWAVSKLDKTRVDNKEIKVAWAPNRGIKDNDDLRQFWDDSEGCTYIPIDRFPASDPEKRADLTAGGGEVDPDSLPVFLLEEMLVADAKLKEDLEAKMEATTGEAAILKTPVMPPIPAGLPPMPSMPGMSLPFMPPPPPAFMAAMRQTMAAQMNMGGLHPPFPFPPMMPPILPTPESSNAVGTTNGNMPATQPVEIKPTRTLLPRPSDPEPAPIMGGFGLPTPISLFGMSQMRQDGPS